LEASDGFTSFLSRFEIFRKIRFNLLKHNPYPLSSYIKRAFLSRKTLTEESFQGVFLIDFFYGYVNIISILKRFLIDPILSGN